MNRTLNFESGVIEGEVVRELQSLMPELDNSFTQRKTFDEYYYETTEVELTMEILQNLNDMDYRVLVESEYVLIKY